MKNTPMRVVIGAVVLVAGYALFRFVIFPPSAHISAEQLASLQKLEPRLPELVVSQPEAATLAADMSDCTGKAPAATPAVDESQGARADSAWCSIRGSFVLSTVALPAEGSVVYVAQEAELHAAPAGQAKPMMEAVSSQLVPIQGSATFITLDGLGPYSHALKFRATYPGQALIFEYYNVHFIENFVSVEITVAQPGNPVNDGAVAALAQGLYNRVGTALAEQSVPQVSP